MNIEFTLNKSFNEFLSTSLIRYKESSKKSDRNITELTGLHRRTLNKVIDGTAIIKSIAPSKIARLIKLTTKENSVNVIEHYKDELVSLSQSYKMFFNGFNLNSLVSNEQIDYLSKISEDRFKFTIYSLATMQMGTSVKEVIDILGNRAVEHIGELVLWGMIKEDNGRYYKTTEGKTYFGVEHERNVMSHLSDLYNYKNSGKERNVGAHTVESISSEALKECQSVLLSAMTKINQIIKEENNKGEIPFYAGIIMDTFTTELPENTGGLQ